MCYIYINERSMKKNRHKKDAAASRRIAFAPITIMGL